MVKRRGVLFAVVLVTSAGLLATPAAAKSRATLPGAPMITGVLAGRHGATFSFTAPTSSGGASITRYRARCTPVSGGGGPRIGYSHTTPLFVSLRAGTSYSCTIAAGNRSGFGPESGSITASVDRNAGTHCTNASGTATFTPPLPKLGKIGNNPVVNTVLTMTGTLGGCTLGGVTSASTSLVSSQITAADCATFAGASPPPIIATLTITWNTQATSTIPVRIQAPRGRPTSPVLTGTVTAGLFLGLHLTSTLGISLGKTGCTLADLSTAPYTQLTPTDIA